LPASETITRARSIPGKELNVSIRRIMISSKRPPEYPENIPRAEPMAALPATVARAVNKVYFAPAIIRRKTSLPKLSVPNK
jgi:hypothetical protein